MKYIPYSPKELLQLRPFDKVRYGFVLWLAGLFRLWNYPMKAEGDLARMKFPDKAYWMHKTTSPILRGPKNAGMESYFKAQTHERIITSPVVDPQSTLKIRAVGDLMPNAFLSNSGDTLYKNISRSLFEADLSMANLESPIVESDKTLKFRTDKGPPLSMSQEQFDVIKGFEDKTFDFLSTACNHSLDFGAAGVESTIECLEKNNILFNGTCSENNIPTIFSKNGIKLGIIAYTFGLNAFLPPEERPGIVNCLNLNDHVNEIDLSSIERQIELCRQDNTDFIIMHLHWGLEYEFYSTTNQITVAKHLAELGIDCIIGHHPHVIQPVEYYKTQRDSNRVVPIFYSLGNLVNPFSAPYLSLSWLANIELSKGRDQDNSLKTYVQNVEIIPVVQDIHMKEERLYLYHRADAKKYNIKLYNDTEPYCQLYADPRE